MTAPVVNEQDVLNALHRVPRERWHDALALLESLAPENAPLSEGNSIRTFDDLSNSGLIGIWTDRTDITDNHAFARNLRQKASRRRRAPDAP